MITRPRHVLFAPDARLSALLARASTDPKSLPLSTRRSLAQVRRWDHATPLGLVFDGADLVFGAFTVTVGGVTVSAVSGVPFGDGFTCAWAMLRRTESGFELT